MSRYKGRTSLRENESKFPQHVDMMVPEGGFGSRLNAMHDWHDAHGIDAMRGQSRRENGRDIIDVALLTRKSRRYSQKSMERPKAISIFCFLQFSLSHRYCRQSPASHHDP
jgi:hypothetical protein